MNQTNIGSYIARKRREKNLTQEQLAERLGVSNKTISKWENGKCSRPCVRPVSVHPAESGAVLHRGHSGAADHDEPEPSGGEESPPRRERL